MVRPDRTTRRALARVAKLAPFARCALLTAGALALAAGGAHAQAPGRRLDAEAENRPTSEDEAAGLLGLDFPWRGTRRFDTVPGEVPAPGPGLLRRVKIRVERGLSVDASAFAGFVMETLNDPRGWTHGGVRTFARTAGESDLTITLASPATSAALCRPYDTAGILSCGKPRHAILTMHRWVLGVRGYGDADGRMTEYRRYLVNHEVGHVLGKDHARCRRRGALAPVMLPQTKSLDGCRPNPWPFPEN